MKKDRSLTVTARFRPDGGLGHVVCWLFSIALLIAQQPAAEPKFSVTSRLVVVSVIVKDRDGKPIENSKPEDFTLLEDNKPQKISVFEYQRLDTEPTRAELLKVPGLPNATEPGAAAAPTVRFKDRRLLVLFFDFSSMPPEDQIRAQKAAVKFVEEQITPSDVVSIMAFTNKLRVVQEFTADRERLLEAIHSFRIGEASELAAEGAVGESEDDTLFAADET